MKLYLEIGILNHIYTYENVKTKVPLIKKSYEEILRAYCSALVYDL